MKILIGVAFLVLFGIWTYLEFVSRSQDGLKEVLFWGAMMLVFLSGIEVRPKRLPDGGA